MIFRKSEIKDIKEVMNIINDAKKSLKNQGLDQWQSGYPNEESIKEDIKKDISYVLEKDEKILGTAAISFDGDKTYEKIYKGNWISTEEFAVIHRIAVLEEAKGQGITGQIIKETENLCNDRNIKSIKIDTHKDNIPMQNSIKKNGFEYCGIIYVCDGSARVAFEKYLK